MHTRGENGPIDILNKMHYFQKSYYDTPKNSPTPPKLRINLFVNLKLRYVVYVGCWWICCSSILFLAQFDIPLFYIYYHILA